MKPQKIYIGTKVPQQLCILFAADRKSGIVAQMAGYGRISSMEIEGVIGDYLKGATCFCTDAGKNFITYAQEKGIEHQVLNANKGERVKGIYRIQHINDKKQDMLVRAFVNSHHVVTNSLEPCYLAA